jgi:two-component system chemotaxis sensor kinase CheA
MGLLVDEILDIVEDRLEIELTTERPGMLGSAIIDGEATDVVDTSYYLTQAYGDWFVPHGGETTTVAQTWRKRRVLLVDDSAFFRNLLSPLLSVAGYAVTTVESADRALELYEKGMDYDIILGRSPADRAVGLYVNGPSPARTRCRFRRLCRQIRPRYAASDTGIDALS